VVYYNKKKKGRAPITVGLWAIFETQPRTYQYNRERR